MVKNPFVKTGAKYILFLSVRIWSGRFKHHFFFHFLNRQLLTFLLRRKAIRVLMRVRYRVWPAFCGWGCVEGGGGGWVCVGCVYMTSFIVYFLHLIINILEWKQNGSVYTRTSKYFTRLVKGL